MLPTVLVTETLDPVPANWLAQRVNLLWTPEAPHDKPAEFDRHLPEAQGLVIRTYTLINDALLDRAPALRVIGRAGVGLDNVDLPACKRRGVRVVYTPDANTQAVVEYVLGLMLDTYRPRTPLQPHATDAEFHQQRKIQVGAQLDKLTLGILGFGRIGKRLARVAHALGMRVLVNDILPESQLRAAIDFPVTFVSQSELFSQSDVLSIHVDGRPENRAMIGSDALKKLKPSCLFINAARGMLVDSAALAEWARAVQSQGGRVILDVHEPEPPSANYPLWGLPNVMILPHLASRTATALTNMSWVVRDVAAVLEGKTPQFPAE